ncbi:MAG: hypothetical protein Q7R84_00320, partial [bacterium]|nr:hypothetical protein [bacterium]
LLGLTGVPVFVFGLACVNDSDCASLEGRVCRSNVCVFEGGSAVSVTIESLQPGGGTTPTGRGGFEESVPAEIIFKGMAYPHALLTILRQGQVAATFLADDKGYFEKKITGLIEGVHIFDIFAEDSEGRKSITLNYTIHVLWNTKTTLSNIFIPPTIFLAKTEIPKEQILDIGGESFPRSDVYLLISPGLIAKTAQTGSDGKWLFGLDTDKLIKRTYQVKAKGILQTSQQSEFSQSLSFTIGPPVPVQPKKPLSPPSVCQGADLNFDGKVNLIDFSILLFWWGISKENTCADIQGDGYVDIVDFSIMMYYWAG